MTRQSQDAAAWVLVCLQQLDLSRSCHGHIRPSGRELQQSHKMQVCNTLLATSSAGGSEAAERAPLPAAVGAEGGQTQGDDGELKSRLFLVSCYLSAGAGRRTGPLPKDASCLAYVPPLTKVNPLSFFLSMQPRHC